MTHTPKQIARFLSHAVGSSVAGLMSILMFVTLGDIHSQWFVQLNGLESKIIFAWSKLTQEPVLGVIFVLIVILLALVGYLLALLAKYEHGNALSALKKAN